jgi:hypothetical protein
MALSALPCPYGTVVDLDHRNNNSSRRRNSSINNNSNNMPPFIPIQLAGQQQPARGRRRGRRHPPCCPDRGQVPEGAGIWTPPLPANDACAGEEKGAHAPDTQDGLVRSLAGIIGCLNDCIIAATTKKAPAKKTVRIGGSKSRRFQSAGM